MLQSRPALQDPKPYTFPKPRRIQVGGGTVVAIDVPGQLYAAVRLVQPGGGAAEPLDRAGVAALTGEALEDGINGDSSLAPALERYGAEAAFRTSWDGFVAGVDAPVSRIADATALFAEALRKPALRPDDVLRRRDQRIERFRLDNSMHMTLAVRTIGAQLYTGRYATPLGGAPADLRAITPEMVAAHHADSIASVAGTLVVVGDLTGVDLEALGRTVFGDAVPTTADVVAAPEPAKGEVPRIVVLDKPGSVQSALIVAHRAPARGAVDLVPAESMAEVLGGMFNSRLNMELRERLGYTYGAGCRFDLRRNAGMFYISTQVEAPTTAHSLSTTLAEIEKLRSDGPTEAELTAVKESNTVGLPVAYSTSRSLAAALVEMVVYDLPEDHVDQVRAGYERLTAEELHSAAREYLRPEEAVVVIAGDAGELSGPLGDLGIGPVTVRDPETLWS